MKKLLFGLFLVGILLTSTVCFAAHVSIGTSGTPGNVELIRIYIDPYGHPLEETERLLAEQDVISKLTVNEKIYFSEEERIKDKLQQNYDIEDVHKDGKDFWKCTPKNPKNILVRKS